LFISFVTHNTAAYDAGHLCKLQLQRQVIYDFFSVLLVPVQFFGNRK